MAYAEPPFTHNPGTKTAITKQSPPREYDFDTGVFQVALTLPPWVEVGTTMLVKATFAHYKDGAIQPVSQQAFVIDPSGNTVPSTGGAYALVTAVTQDPGASNAYYVMVQFGNLPAGSYVLRWIGQYTPIGASPPPLPIEVRQAFRVQMTLQDSDFYFLPTDSF